MSPHSRTVAVIGGQKAQARPSGGSLIHVNTLEASALDDVDGGISRIENGD